MIEAVLSGLAILVIIIAGVVTWAIWNDRLP